MITNKEILQKIVAIEKTNLHNSFFVNGQNYWPAIRIRLAFSLIEKRYKSQIKKNYLSKKNINFFLKFFFFSRKNKKNVDVLFVSHSNYINQVDGKKYDRVLEGKKLECKNNKKSFLVLNLENFDILNSSENHLVANIGFASLLIKIYVYFTSLIFRENKKHLDEPINDIRKKFDDSNIQLSFSTLKLKQYVLYVNLLTKYYKYLLKRIGVQEVFQATYYDPVGLSINSAANQLGISTYCVQHGGQSRNNPAFGQWTNMPSNGYNMLPKFFLCWDSWSADAIEEWSTSSDFHKSKIIGYQWPDLWKSGYIKYSNREKMDNLAKNKVNILYTMQPSIGNLPKQIQRAIENYSSRINWWVRIHPRQKGSKIEKDLVQKYSSLENIFIIEATSEPLPVIMSLMDLHITGFSSSVYEAIAFNVKTIFIDQSGNEYFEDIIQSGYAKLSLSFNELEKNINEVLLR